MKPNEHRKQKCIKIMAAALLPLALICWFGRAYLADSPFASERALEGPSFVSSGPSGRVYVVDGGKKTVLILDETGALESSAEAENDGFYYASIVAEGFDGSVYIVDALYSGAGTALSAERIFRCGANGANPALIHEISYENEADPPLQYGRITSLAEIGGKLVFAQRLDEGATVSTLDLNSGELQETFYPLEGLYLSDVNVQPSTLRPVFTGEAVLVSGSGRVAWRVCADETSMYYTDLAANELVKHELATGKETAVIAGEDVLYTVFEAGGRLYSTDGAGYYAYEKEAAAYTAAARLKHGTERALVWTALLLLALLALALITLLLKPVFGKQRSATFQRVVIVLLVALCVGATISYVILDQLIARQSGSVMEQISLFNDILRENVDVGALKKIDSVSGYRSGDYLKVKAPLDALTRLSYENAMYSYYAIYATDGETIYGVLDYEDTITARHPFYAYGTEGYTDAFLGETVEYAADVSSFGSWSFVLKPIFDETGAVAAVMEVGVNLDALTAEISALTIEVVLMVASVALVLMILIFEWVFYMEHLDTRRLLRANARQIPARTLIFLVFLADCMQDAFVSVLAMELYVPFFGIPQSIGAALPLSAQVLASALFAFFGGGLVYRGGIKSILPLGFIAQISGFLVCGAAMNYIGLLAGKALIGAGMGLIIVSVNTAAAVDEKKSAKQFAAISAGTLAGVSAGSGVGSVVLSLGSYTAVYYVGAAILLIGFMLSLSVAVAEPRAKRSARKANTFAFISDGKVFSFLLLMLTPFLIAISFREYFFPIYAADMGVSEADIGRIYLGCGLIVIYAGPTLTRRTLAKLGGKRTVALASALMAAATLLFAFVPRLGAAVAGLALLSLATAFGYAAQSTYYASLDGVTAYGEGRAMGVYSLFDNGGQTLGPIIYGAAMLMGYQSGLFIIGIAIAALTGLFIAVNIKRGKRNGR